MPTSLPFPAVATPGSGTHAGRSVDGALSEIRDSVAAGVLAARPSGEGEPVAARLRPVLAVGAVALALAALPYKAFELDRFLVPKEVVLAVTAVLALVSVVRARSGARGVATRPPADGVDLALAAFLAVSTVSALQAASGWLAVRALGVTFGGLALFWAARAAARVAPAVPLLRAVALVPVLAAVATLAQAYGLESQYFSLNRAPGGTFGNRNFVAHLCAIALPLLAYLTVRARRGGELAFTAVGFAAASAALVLTRSRGAWLAVSVAGVPIAIGALRAAAARRAEAGRGAVSRPAEPIPVGAAGAWAAAFGRRPPLARPGNVDLFHLRRVPLLLAAAAGVVVAAVRLPNALDWRSASPYLDSARDVVNYREGSGQGRLKQWRNSAGLVRTAPLLGVGPGNWTVRYPAVAPAHDPSLTRERATANPWPSSDWVAFASERGLAGLVSVSAAFLLLFWRAHVLVWRARDANDRLLGGTLAAVLAAAATAGMFDAVLLLAAPAFLAWGAAGALVGATDTPGRLQRVPVSRAAARIGTAILILSLAAAAAVAGVRVAAMRLLVTGRPTAVEWAARLAPGDYRVQLRAAQLAAQGGRCAVARRRAGAARTLNPASVEAARVLRACPERRGGR